MSAPPPERRRWLLLDIGGVLEIVDDAEWPRAFGDEWASRLGVPRDAFSRRLAAADLPDTRLALGVEGEYWRRIEVALGIDAVRREEMRADFWDRYCGREDTALKAFLETLRGTVGLAILSNSADGAREQEERRYRFSELFAPILYSHELGEGKPGEAAFRAAFQAMGAEAQDVLFIDDIEENVVAARGLGAAGHRHVDTAETIRAVRGWLT